MADVRFVRRFQFEAIAVDGAEVRDTIHARDHESAQADLRRRQLVVYRLRQIVSPEDLERRCGKCKHVSNWSAAVIRLEQRRLHFVSVLDHETSHTLCEDYSDSAARTLAALLAQRTGWVLDDRLPD